jgi:hypothetical protein
MYSGHTEIVGLSIFGGQSFTIDSFYTRVSGVHRTGMLAYEKDA